MRPDLKERTKRFALDVLQLAGCLRADSLGWSLKPQLIRAGTGVGSNYRAACRSKSRADFIARLTTAEEEADETAYWLELLAAVDAVPIERTRPLLQEASELSAIFVSSVKRPRGIVPESLHPSPLHQFIPPSSVNSALLPNSEF